MTRALPIFGTAATGAAAGGTRHSRGGLVLLLFTLLLGLRIVWRSWSQTEAYAEAATAGGAAADVSPCAPPQPLSAMAAATAAVPSEADEDAALEAEWSPIVNDWLRPWDRPATPGITRDLLRRILALRKYVHPMHVVVQFVRGRLYLVDPFKHCVCGNSALPDTDWAFIGRRCRYFLTLLSHTLAGQPRPPPDFEFVLDAAIPAQLQKPFEAWPVAQPPLPVFSPLRCWPKGGFSVPMPGTHTGWSLSSMDAMWDNYTTGDGVVPFADRAGKAVFRGGFRGCSNVRDVFVATEDDWARNRSTCGRRALYAVASANPDEVDYILGDRIPMLNQSRAFRYVVYAEGWGAWAERLGELFATGMVPMVQETMCDIWYENVAKPWRDFIPLDHYFANLPGRVRWANAHLRQAEAIAGNAVAFARRYLRRRGTVAYMRVLFTEYAKRMGYTPTLREGALLVEEEFLARPLWRYQHCADPANLPYFANYTLGSVPFGERDADDGGGGVEDGDGSAGARRVAEVATSAATVAATAAASSTHAATAAARKAT